MTLSTTQVDYVTGTLEFVVAASIGSLTSEACDAAISFTSALVTGAASGNQSTSLSTQAASSLLHTLSTVHQQTQRLSAIGASNSSGTAQTSAVVSLVNQIAVSVSSGIQLGAPAVSISTPAVNVSSLSFPASCVNMFMTTLGIGCAAGVSFQKHDQFDATIGVYVVSWRCKYNCRCICAVSSCEHIKRPLHRKRRCAGVCSYDNLDKQSVP